MAEAAPIPPRETESIFDKALGIISKIKEWFINVPLAIRIAFSICVITYVLEVAFNIDIQDYCMKPSAMNSWTSSLLLLFLF